MRRALSIAMAAGLALTSTIGSAEPDKPKADAPSAPVAVEKRTLSLDEVVRVANDRFPLILAAEEDKKAAEGELLAAEGGFDPLWKTMGALVPVSGYPQQRLDTWLEQPTPLWGASLMAGYRIGRGSYPAYDGKLETNNYGEVRGGLRVPVVRDGPIDRRRANIKRASLGVDIAKLSKDQQHVEITRIASQRYWDWVGAGRRVTIVSAWLDLALGRDAGLASRVARGEIPDIEREENRRTILQRRTQLVAVERGLEQASIDLSLLYRRADGTPELPSSARLPGSIPEPSPIFPLDAKADEARAPGERPEIRRFEAQREQAKVELEFAKNQRLPAIDLSIMVSKDLGPGDTKRDKPVVELGVSIDVPLLARPQRGRIEVQRAALRKIEIQADLQRDRVIAEVRDAASAVRAARTRAEVASREVALAEKLQAAELKRFDLGDSTMLLVNLREQATAEAKLREVDALVDYHKAVAAYRAALGERPKMP